ncbi:hypothetical protein CEUSTIGMA_g13370.t1 [Chlamydomonas eustigma]|uniref:Uncharacterized protein n=1 Tax=Chlamydomonas eustigma TaxID=1157962 RepID=A0A250XSB7_9CHLO|nr:hypothetical protein CEUSTIGMA_g13370.t1 [Chlamydomonas eustigma]|eukprot:GAX85954.1 hypothetical protein CEUSTIGMA_g13370.t1 [Chlamydomonas eustigma]
MELTTQGTTRYWSELKKEPKEHMAALAAKRLKMAADYPLTYPSLLPPEGSVVTFPSGVVHRWDDRAVTFQGKNVATFVKMKNPKITFERLQTIMKKGWEEADKFFYEDVDMETLPDAEDDDKSNKSADSSSSADEDSEAAGMTLFAITFYDIMMKSKIITTSLYKRDE